MRTIKSNGNEPCLRRIIPCSVSLVLVKLAISRLRREREPFVKGKLFALTKKKKSSICRAYPLTRSCVLCYKLVVEIIQSALMGMSKHFFANPYILVKFWG